MRKVPLPNEKGRPDRLLPLLIFAISFLIYLPSLKYGFVWDDWSIVFREIKNLQGLSIYKPGSIYYRPVTTLTFLLDQMIWKTNPLGYHLTNTIVHALNSCLFFYLAKSIIETKLESRSSRSLALIPAIIFAAYPIHVESVSWVAGRTDLVVTLFVLLTFMSYHLYRLTGNTRALIPSFIFFLLSLGAKETGVIALPLILLWELLVASSLYGNRDKKAIIATLVMGVSLVLYVISRLPGIESYTGGIKNPSILPLLKALGFYMRYLLLPFPILNYIPHIPPGVFHLFLASLLILLVSMGLFLSPKAVWWFKGFELSMLLTTLAILPSLALITLGIGATPLALRYLYLPSVFFCLGLAFLLVSVEKYISNPQRASIPPVVLLILFVPINIKAQGIWKSEIIFWEKAVCLAPNNAIPHNQYGLALASQGKIKEAQREFLKALKAPDIQDYPWEKSKIYINLGRALLQQKKYTEAMKALNTALKFDPTNKSAYCFKADVYLAAYKSKKNKNLTKKAYQCLKECITYTSTPSRLFLAARLALFLNKKEEAQDLLKKLILQYPDSKEAQLVLQQRKSTEH